MKRLEAASTSLAALEFGIAAGPSWSLRMSLDSGIIAGFS
jgi:hypothetical protein